jgi:inhibitor of the pro-sigma K processing machinery
MDAFQVSLVLILLFVLASAMLRYKINLLHWLGRGLVQVVMGLFFLFVINLLAGLINAYIPYNVVTVAIASLLGLPGALALLGIQLYLNL